MRASALAAIACQPRAVRLLAGAAAAPSHAYLFVGPEHTGKHTAALALAQALNCTEGDGCGVCRECRAVLASNHPDVRVWELGEGEKTFKVEQVRQLIAAVAYQPYQGKRKVHVLAAFDAVQPAGANALLKTLEEPPGQTTLVLFARSAETVLPTIASRCQIVPFGLAPDAAIAAALQARMPLLPETALHLARRSQGRFGVALTLAAEPPEEPAAPNWPNAADPLAWADALAQAKEPEQQAALESLLFALHTGAREAADTGTPRPWLEAAVALEAAREALRGHHNARLVFDRLAEALVAAGLVENAPSRVIR